MPWYCILLIVIVSLLLLIFVVNAIFTQDLIRPKRITREMQKQYNVSHHLYDEVTLLPREEISFTMKDGYVIHGDYSLVDKKKFVLLAHGRGVTREGLVRYACLFQELGYSTLIYDERGHGDNKRCSITMGKKESMDMVSIIEEMYLKFGEDIELGLFGFSMGGANCLLSLKYQQKVNFVISDCAYSQLENVVRGVYQKHHLFYGPLKPFTWLYLELFHGFSLKDDAPYYTLKHNRVPILYLHGAKDDFVQLYNLDELYEVTTSYKEKVIFENAKHAHSLASDRVRYKKSIQDFLEAIHTRN